MKAIKDLIDLIRRDTSKENETEYFMVLLRWSICLMIVYYLIYIGVCCIWEDYTYVIAAFVWIAMMGVGLWMSYHYSDRGMFNVYMIMMISWSILSVLTYGWGVGGQHFLLPLLVMVFFYVHYDTNRKIVIMVVLLMLRLLLFVYCQTHTPAIQLEGVPVIILQILNSVTLFVGMTISCISFSSKIQGAEKKLMQANQRLQAQASTDPLTNLPNRRYMKALIENWMENNPTSNFTIVMADIDFFKIVNDSWGHDCGDAVLKSLSSLFLENVKKKGYVCRWGGEEFFFFYPELNLDEAKFEIDGISIAVRNTRVMHGDHEIRVTMTFGLEENDFRSSLQELICKADEKLYYGKDHGRNCVIG